jgi:tRNA pseudouridine55 synthase
MRWLLPVDCGIESWPRVDLDADETRRVLDGQVLEMPATSGPGSNVRLYGPLGQFLGIAQLNEQGRLAPRRLIANQRRQ